MANDGNVVLLAGGAPASVVTRAGAAAGVGTLTRVVNTPGDDEFVAIPLPFSVLFNGASYTTVYIGSNGYLTFGGGSQAYSNLGPANPPFPGILICAADRSYQRVYAGSEDGNATFRVRYEGSSATSGTDGSPTVAWEIKFTAANPSQFLLDIGVLASVGTGISGVSNGVGPAYIAALTPAATTGYTLSFEAQGNFTVSAVGGQNTANFSNDWRVLIQATGVGSRTFIQEIEFRTAVGVAEPLSGGTISASGNTTGHPPENVIGPYSNSNIYWDSGANTPTFIRYTFTEARTVRQYLIRASEGTTAPTDFQLQYLNGVGTWTTVDSRAGVPSDSWGVTNPKTFDVTYTTSNDGNITMPLFDAAGTGSGPVSNSGAVTLPFPTLAASGGPTGNFGNVALPLYAAAGQFVVPDNPIDGAVNVGFLDVFDVYQSPWQMYGILVSLPVGNVSNGDCRITDIFSGDVLSVDGRIDPPLALPFYDVNATGFAGSAADADITITLDVSGTGYAGNMAFGDARLPVYDAAGDTGNNGDANLAPYTLSAAAFAGVAINGAGLLEALDVSGTAYSSTISGGDIALPTFVVVAGVTSSSVINGAAIMPKLSAKGDLLSGASIAGMITVPVLSVSARGYASVVGNASVKIPALRMDGWMTSIPAALTPADFKTIVMNSRTRAVSTYENLAANSLCEFNGMVLAATADGIVALTGEKDGNADIDAFIRSSVSQYGTQFFKRVINGYIGYRADGKMKVTLYTDERHEYTYPLAPRQIDTIHPSKVKFGRGVEGRYWQWKISNVAGAGFEIDNYEMDVDVLTRRV